MHVTESLIIKTICSSLDLNQICVIAMCLSLHTEGSGVGCVEAHFLVHTTTGVVNNGVKWERERKRVRGSVGD